MEKERLKIYQKFRAHGYSAYRAFNATKTLLDFQALEEIGLVRLVVLEEQENYFDVYGEPDTEKERRQIIDFINTYGCWYARTDTKCPCCKQWESADSIGMLTYKNPENPFENDYIIDIMQSAINQVLNNSMAA